VSRITIATWDEATGAIGVGRTLTAVSGDADGAIWSPDSKRLMFTAQVYPECSVKAGARAVSAPTHRDTAAMDGAPGIKWAGMEPASWAEEDACDKAKDDAAEKSPVKAQVWDALLYRHWDHYTGEKRSHILVVDADGGGSSKSNDGVRDLTPASAVGDAETPTWMLGGPLEYAWAPDSKEIAYVTNLDKVPAASTNNDVFTLRLDEPGAKAVKVSTSLGSDDEPEYSPDGKWLAFRSQKQAGFESDRFRLMVVQRVSESASQRVSGREWAEPKELMPKFDRWVDEFAWAPDSRKLYIASGDLGSEPIFCVNIDGGKLEQLTITGEYSDLHVSPDGSRLVAGRMTIAEPTKLVSLELGHVAYPGDYPPPSRVTRYLPPPTDAAKRLDSQDQLTHLNDALLSELDLTPALGNSPKFGLDQTEWFWFAGAGGRQVEGFIIRPPNFDYAKKYPVKFVMHGGPQTALGDSWSYRWNWELLAADGYVVVGINRRGSTGYGQKFVDEVSGDWGGRAYEDLMKGLDYAEATYPFLDKTRECALGASYGGFMADWVLTHTNRFKCIVTHDGMVDPVSAYGTTEEMWFNEWEFRRPEDFPKGWDGFSAGYDPMGHPAKTNAGILRSAQNDKQESSDVGHPAEPWRYQNLPAEQDPFRKWSALRSIENAKTPTLIIHSQRDYRLDVSQGFELYTALQRRGVPARFLYFPDEGHWVLKPQNSQLWYKTVDDWCDRWTKTGKYAETK
jgi:dipeptidyl aminopeptidase/acylaminoacyl peptidase